MLIDLDKFKDINDSYGHAAGDLVLRVVAKRMREAVRFHDVAVRHGGDEFVLILPQADPELASALAGRVLSRVSETPVDMGDGMETDISISLGLVTWNGLEDGGELEKRADQAMYQAKKQGGKRFVLAL